MKKKLIYGSLGLLGLSMVLACSNDEDDNPLDPVQAVGDIENNVVAGDWMISSYVDSGVDETSDYDAYTFSFTADGVVSASSAAEMLTGAWSVQEDDSSDGDVDFTLFFGVADTHPFDDLNDDWDVVSYTSTMISLRDVSGGSGEIDTLVFTRK